MLAALILAAGAAAIPARNLDQRVSLVEARQMLQSQTLWTLQAAVPPEAAKALGDLDLHLQQDRERDEKMERLESTVTVLEQRLQAIELMLGDRSIAEGAPVRVAPPPPAQTSAMVLKVKPQAKSVRPKHAKGAAAAASASKNRAERMSAQQP